MVQELRGHDSKSHKYLVLHNTTTFKDKTERHRRRWPVVHAFVREKTFCPKERYENQKRLTVLEQTRP